MKTETSTSKPVRRRRLSVAQIEVLLAGREHKLFRSSMGWSADENLLDADVAYIFSPATIKSLAKMGLIDANFDDPRGFEKRSLQQEIQNYDGARHADGGNSEVASMDKPSGPAGSHRTRASFTPELKAAAR